MANMCYKCKSKNVKCIGCYSIQIAIDDVVDINQIICLDCGADWDE